MSLGSARSGKPKIYIIFYSAWGHAKTMAEKIKESVDEAGLDGILYQVAETLSAEIVEKMHAPAKPWPGIPVISAADLPQADGFIFGYGTRYGQMPAQVKALWDATGQLWQQGALVGKPFSLFFGSASQGGGQETTALTSLSVMVHHGMVYIPLGFTLPVMFDLETPHGGSAWGAGYLSGGDGSRPVSEKELAVATHLGKHFSKIASKLLAK